jgi:hypothetical protein
MEYGERFASAHAAHYFAWRVIRDFTDRHPLHVPDPARPQTAGGPLWVIKSPVPHTLRRDGDTLSCIECGESVHAPSPPPRPLTPQEYSASRFD